MTYPVLISKASFLAVTAAELRDYLRGDDGDSDTTLNFYIRTATEYLEIAARRSIIRKRFMVEFDNCKKLLIRLPMGHVDSLVIIEADGVIQNLNYYYLKDDVIRLPTYHSTIKVTYDVGFSDMTSVPDRYKLAVLACAADLFIHRFSAGEAIPPISQQIVHYYGAFLKSYRLE